MQKCVPNWESFWILMAPCLPWPEHRNQLLFLQKPKRFWKGWQYKLVKYCAEFTHFFSFLKAISRIFTFLNFRLVNLPDVHVVVISGREVENLRAKVGVDGLTYAGNHGLHVMHADGQMYQHTIPQVNFKFPLFLSCA